MANIIPFDPIDDGFFSILPALLRPVNRGTSDQVGRMDLVEKDQAYELSVELPGIRKDGIQVSIYENHVTVNAEAREEKEAGEQTSWLLKERSFGKFTRTVSLPKAVDENGAVARHVDGVLYLKLPKKEASSVRRLTIH